MKATVTVMLKSGVLDPQGKAIGHALHTLGFSNVGDVRAGKGTRADWFLRMVTRSLSLYSKRSPSSCVWPTVVPSSRDSAISVASG